MSASHQRKSVRILFDEFHSESWSVSESRARQIQPENPSNSSYQIAADLLSERDFKVLRNLDKPLHRKTLAAADVLALVHPCESKWESTTSSNSPRLSPEEISTIQEFVWNGGGLLVIAEYEHDKYGDNLNDLLSKFGLEIENSTLFDRSACLHENPTWCFLEPADGEAAEGFSHLVDKACVYLAGSCKVRNEAEVAWRTSPHAIPPRAGVIARSQYGKGRVVLATDSNLFGDERIRDFGHRQLWLNLIYWCSVQTFQSRKKSGKIEIRETATSPSTPLGTTPGRVGRSRSWLALKSAINKLRLIQSPDGTVEAARRKVASQHVRAIIKFIQPLQKLLPHQTDYLRQLPNDLQSWVKGGFQKPDFGRSLAAFNPQSCRRDGIEHLVLFPLYTPNASSDIRFEALIIRTPWPDWLAELEKTTYRNEKFVPGHFVDFTEGYRNECAVLFPETVSLAGRPTNNFGVIFCDREAKRLQSYALEASRIVRFKLHPQLECYLGSLALMQDANALWDLIHDKSHSMGELPFDPFMIRQKAPFWMYALEELRVDLRSFCEATRLAQEGFPFAHYVTYAILLDRIFRFPITGPRVRNYDALGGQLLFAFLHQKDALIWSDNQLTIRWDLLADAVNQLREELVALYKGGADSSKMAFWIAAHDLISRYVKPNVGSKWKQDRRAITDESDPKHWIAIVNDDEFPLGNFHVNLLAKFRSN